MHTFKRLDVAGIAQNSKLMLLNTICGGGKRGRTEEAATIIFAPSVEDGDIPAVRELINKRDYDMVTLIQSLSVPKLEEFYETFINNPKTGNIESYTKSFLQYVPEIAAIQDYR